MSIENLANECVVYDALGKQAHTLNSSLTWIWQRCDGQTEVEAIASAFEREFQCTGGMDAVMSGVSQLANAELLEKQEQSAAAAAVAAGMSRRSVVAAGSALFPAIATVMAPTAAAAKSKEYKEPKPKPKK